MASYYQRKEDYINDIAGKRARLPCDVESMVDVLNNLTVYYYMKRERDYGIKLLLENAQLHTNNHVIFHCIVSFVTLRGDKKQHFLSQNSQTLLTHCGG